MGRPTTIFDWAKDEDFLSGDAIGNPTKVAPAGPAQGHIPGTAITAEVANYTLSKLASYLAYEAPLRNWQPRVALSGPSCLVWTPSIANGLWAALGANGSLDYSLNGQVWTADDSGGSDQDWTAAFDGGTESGTDVYGHVFGCAPTSSSATDSFAAWDGNSYPALVDFNSSNSEDRAHCGLTFNAGSGSAKVVILGHYDHGSGGLAAGKILLTSADHDDLATWNRVTTDTTLASPSVFRIAQKPGSRIIALVSTATTIDSFKSGNGTSWTHTADITGGTNAQLADVTYDVRNDRWTMLTLTSGIWIATPGSEGSTWTQLCSDPAATVGVGTGCGKIRVAGNRMVVTSANASALFVSDDSGTTWSVVSLGYSQIQDIAYSPERAQWVILDTSGTQVSLAI
jgi:hypothetical protein